MTTLTRASSPALLVDPIDYVLVDLATGRHLPGDAVHAEQLAHEHGLPLDDALDALDEAWRLGLVSRTGSPTSGIVCWTLEVTQIALHRLARAMVAAVSGGPRCESTRGLIDCDAHRLTLIELFALDTLPDLDVFVEIARALLGAWMPTLLDELAMPVVILLSETAQRVHGFEPGADALTRSAMVGAIVDCLIDGRTDAFGALVADYVLALSTQ